MSDYNLFNFTLREADVLRVLRDAATNGYRPLIMINGMFYNVELDNVLPATPGDPAVLPF